MILKQIVAICGVLVVLATIGNVLKSTPKSNIDLICKAARLLTGLTMMVIGIY